MTGPADLIEKMGLLLETTTSCVSPFIQDAATQALDGDQKPIEEMVNEFRKRRDLLVDGLNSIKGISCIEPKGAFYAFPNIKRTGLGSEEFSDHLLEKAGVATCPGNFFGEQGEGFVRFCYASSRENIYACIERIKKNIIW